MQRLRVMQRLRRDEGAVAVLVAILAVVLFGFGALVIDVGALYQERRELQNGADAAALAVATGCALSTCGDVDRQARDYADSNAEDGASYVRQVCGTGDAALIACVPGLSFPGNGHVVVRTETGTRASTALMPPTLARVLDPAYNGKTVHAVAVANWGSPNSLLSVLPFAIGDCEWEHYTRMGLTYPGTIDPLNWPTRDDGTSLEAKISLSNGPIPCPGSPPGGDSSGGFGWLGADGSSCTEVTVVNDFVGNRTGIGTAGCNYESLVGRTVHLPVFDCQTDLRIADPDYDPLGKCYGQGPDSGAAVRYHVVGYAAFYITGIHLPGVRVNSRVTGRAPCSGSEKCFSGFFTTGLAPNAGSVGSGTSFGSNAVGVTYLAD